MVDTIELQTDTIGNCRFAQTRHKAGLAERLRWNRGGRLSSCRMRLRSTSGPRLALHEVLRLDLESEGTITVADQILIRPRRRDWSRPAGNAAFLPVLSWPVGRDQADR